MFKPHAKIWERFEVDKADSDAAAFACLLLVGEMTVKLSVVGLAAAIRDDRDRSRYQQLHRLVRADGVGDWHRCLMMFLWALHLSFYSLRQGSRRES